MRRRISRLLGLLALILPSAVLFGGEARGQEPPAELPSALEAVARMRRLLGFPPAGLENSWQHLDYRGRPSLEIKGRAGSADGPSPLVDFAVFDRASRRLASYVFFPHASRRTKGEAILSLAEISSAADARARAALPGVELALESIQRYRASGEESIYYEARYAPQEGEVRYLEPPVRILLDASTGRLFRIEVDADWFDPLPPKKARVSAKAAAKIAAAGLRGDRLTAAFGAEAAPGKTSPGDLVSVRPNGWLGFSTQDTQARPRVAWLVSFTVEHAKERGPHTLFVDAASGRILGGMPGPPP